MLLLKCSALSSKAALLDRLISRIAEQVALKHLEEDENQGESNNGHDAAHNYGGLMEKADYVACYPDQVH